MTESFFAEPREQSVVKATIVAKYLVAWAKVLGPRSRSGKIAYADLFAGQGLYDDGTRSTPLLVIEQAVNDPVLRDTLVTIFYEANSDRAKRLQKAIDSLAAAAELKHKPIVRQDEVNANFAQAIRLTNLVPSLVFMDPWGYKGLSLALFESVLKDWGSECIIFFNYNRINAGLANPRVQRHMNAILGGQRCDAVRQQLRGAGRGSREQAIMTAICEALKDAGGQFSLLFRFKNSRGTRTSHYLIFVTKHVKGYEIMKGIMANESSSHVQGVASFEYNPKPPLPLYRPLDDLKQALMSAFAGKTLKMTDIHGEHNVGTDYVKANYKAALLDLEADGLVIPDPPAGKRRQGTFADDVMVTFPVKAGG
ncbi:MAG: three-Cys-motif partner protein TcmP [Chloroflexi bacterium]|nr:three-Cys-motif partner protein TcmP [Chloroflexota bacterium]